VTMIDLVTSQEEFFFFLVIEFVGYKKRVVSNTADLFVLCCILRPLFVGAVYC